MTSMEMLLNDLKYAELSKLTEMDLWQYLYTVDNKSVWKNKKLDTIVNEFLIYKYELWKNHLIMRVFYVNQKWVNKEKQYCNIYEVQRYLAGAKQKWSKWLRHTMFNSLRPAGWLNYEDCEYQLHTLEVLTPSSGSYGRNRLDVFKYNSYEYFLKRSVHKYSAFEQSGLEETKLFWYLYQYERHPQLEMLTKMGMLHYALGNFNCIRWKQKGYKILGIENKQEFEELKMVDDLKFYRKHKQAIHKYKINNKQRLYIYEYLLDRNYSNICLKLINYIEDYAVFLSRSPVFLCSIYYDYIQFCEELAIPLTSKNKYPDDLIRVHDDLMTKIEINENKKQTVLIQNYVNEELFKYRFADNDYVITPANSSFDLINESKKLNHCVRTYISNYASRYTAIFLVRKRSNVLEPYFTLELKNNRINQLRGSHNCDPNENVKYFVKKWADKFKLKLNYY